MESICYRFPIRAGKIAEVEAYCLSLNERAAEFSEAMIQAGLWSQALVVLSTPECDYLLIFNRGSDLRASAVEQLKSELSFSQDMWEVFDRTLEIEQGITLPVLAEWQKVEPEA